MAQTHILHCLRDTFWFLPIKSYRATCFNGTKATTACADAPQDHECGCFMSPAFAYIWAARLFTDCVESFIPHQLLEVVVVFSFGRSHSEPFRSAFWNHGRHVVFLNLFFAAYGGEKRKKEFFGSPLLHPPDARAPNPVRGLRPVHTQWDTNKNRYLGCRF